jgi:hypothetical protein
MDAIQAAGMDKLTEKDEREISATAFSMYGGECSLSIVAYNLPLMTVSPRPQLPTIR